jgi:hypothetical protein
MAGQNLMQRFKGTFVGRALRAARRRLRLWRWRAGGSPVPPPDSVKQITVLRYAKAFRLRTFVETGTFMGAMVEAVRTTFHRVVSIELDPALSRRARERFASFPHVTVLEGDSARLLPQVLAGLNEPALFWLDAHFSGGATAKGDLETPIIQELDGILNHAVRDHVILIDDARCFVGANDYPTVDSVRTTVLSRRPGWTFEVRDDIIRIHPAPADRENPLTTAHRPL